jgi:signal peptidase
MTSNAKKIRGTVSNILWLVATVLLIAIFISVFSAQMRGEVPSVFGISILRVISGSMEDEIPTGSYILVVRTDAAKIKRDDVICFYSSDPSIYGYPNTHRVIEDPIKTDTGYEFVTKGDANPKADNYNASSERLIGKYVKTLTVLTAVANFVTGNYTLLFIMGIQIATATMVVFTILKRRAFGSPKGGGNEEKQDN